VSRDPQIQVGSLSHDQVSHSPWSQKYRGLHWWSLLHSGSHSRQARGKGGGVRGGGEGGGERRRRRKRKRRRRRRGGRRRRELRREEEEKRKRELREEEEEKRKRRRRRRGRGRGVERRDEGREGRKVQILHYSTRTLNLFRKY